MKELENQFHRPRAAYRGKPFWSWNGELNEQELIRQIHVMKEMGLGGFFIHSRTGLVTEYLGEEWFRLTNACADEAERLGMEAWLYDEDRWPSGTAGGMVTENPDYRLRYMSLRPVAGAEFVWDADIVAAFACCLDGIAYSDCQRIHRETPSASYRNKTVLIFTLEEMEKSSFYNGYTYVDTLKREATEYYIRLTHERYKAHCGDRFGRSIRGIFTDEPHRGAVMAGFSLPNANRLWMTPWTDTLPSRFQELFGLDLIERLPELFLKPDGQAVSPVKWQYMELLQQMFLKNFAAPLYEWCEENNLLLTGHVLHEDSLTCQAVMQGSLMRFYEYMHCPGVDVLTEGNRNYTIVKQLASSARQLGQQWLLSELYGCTGWQMNFLSHKEVGDWQALFGINLRCHHLSWYTMEGEAKRDYPASILHQSAWWTDYDYVESYFARLGMLLSQGNACCDILVLNPIESVWCQVHVGWAQGLTPATKPVQELEQGYAELSAWLFESHLDFDFGDEEMLDRLSQIERDVEGIPYLHVGQAKYRAVIVGRMTTMRGSTLRLLDDFFQLGGEVIFAGGPSAYVDARPSTAAVNLAARASQIPWGKDQLLAHLRQSVPAGAEILDAADGSPLSHVFCQLRAEGERRYLIAVNISPTQGCDKALIRIPGRGFVEEWDCRTGTRYAIAARSVGGSVEFLTDFPPSGERAFMLTPAQDPDLPGKPLYQEVGSRTCAGPYEYELGEENVCVLDFARHRWDAQPWQRSAEVLKVDRAVRRTLGLAQRGGEMVQPWFQRKYHPAPPVLGRLSLSFDFEVDHLPDRAVFLCVERPEAWRLSLNGTPIAPDSQGWWVDTAFQKILLPAAALKIGPNELILETDFHEGINIETLYLIGSFAVRLDGTRKALTRLPERLHIGDITSQGLPFYGGPLTYRLPFPFPPTDGRTLHITTPGFEAACVKIKSAGPAQGMIAWPPYRAEIPADSVKNGLIELEVMLTRRNTFGPLHQVPLRAGAYGPANFVTEGDGFSEEYMLYPAGLLTPPAISWTAQQ